MVDTLARRQPGRDGETCDLRASTIQICLMPLIMLGQNLQGRHAEARAQADFEVNTKAEREIDTILRHLERQSNLILRILNHMEGTTTH